MELEKDASSLTGVEMDESEAKTNGSPTMRVAEEGREEEGSAQAGRGQSIRADHGQISLEGK